LYFVRAHRYQPPKQRFFYYAVFARLKAQVNLPKTPCPRQSGRGFLPILPGYVYASHRG